MCLSNASTAATPHAHCSCWPVQRLCSQRVHLLYRPPHSGLLFEMPLGGGACTTHIKSHEHRESCSVAIHAAQSHLATYIQQIHVSLHRRSGPGCTNCAAAAVGRHSGCCTAAAVAAATAESCRGCRQSRRKGSGAAGPAAHAQSPVRRWNSCQDILTHCIPFLSKPVVQEKTVVSKLSFHKRQSGELAFAAECTTTQNLEQTSKGRRNREANLETS